MTVVSELSSRVRDTYWNFWDWSDRLITPVFIVASLNAVTSSMWLITVVSFLTWAFWIHTSWCFLHKAIFCSHYCIPMAWLNMKAVPRIWTLHWSETASRIFCSEVWQNEGQEVFFAENSFFKGFGGFPSLQLLLLLFVGRLSRKLRPDLINPRYELHLHHWASQHGKNTQWIL